MPHLASFRQDSTGRYARHMPFKISKKPIDEYWVAVRELLEKNPEIRYNRETKEWTLPINGRTQMRMFLLFPEEWEIIVEKEIAEITFSPD